MQKTKLCTSTDTVLITIPIKYRRTIEQVIEWLEKGDTEVYNTHLLQLMQLTDRNNDSFTQESLFPICELDRNFLTFRDMQYILETVPEYTFNIKMLYSYLCHLRCTGWKGKLIRIEAIYKWNILSLYDFKKRTEEILPKYWHWDGTPVHRKQIEHLAGLEIAKGKTRSRDQQIRKWIRENHQNLSIQSIEKTF